MAEQGALNASDWNPALYLKFADERARPALDLVARVAGEAPSAVVDLGCGPGNSTAMLRQAFPEARLLGFDSSPAMVEAARMAVPSASFATADVAQWLPDANTSLVFSNALFQWLPRHDAVLKRILAALSPGAVLAVQMPDNLQEPSHRLMAEVMQAMGLKAESQQALAQRSSLLDSAGYYNLLKPLAARLDIWRTTYVHPLDGHDAIISMLSSTGLKPFLDVVPAARRDEYLATYRDALSRHYPVMADGNVLLAFPRLFLVARRA